MRFATMLFVLVSFTTMQAAVERGDTFQWSGKLPPGQVVEIQGINGGIRAEPTTGDRVEVVANKTGEFSDPSDVQVEVVEHDGGVTVCAVYPIGDREAAPCQPGAANSAVAGGSDVRVDFTVRVPQGVRFVGRTVNGQVDGIALRDDAEAHTVNGDIHLTTAGAARADTVNGSIVASLGKIPDALKFGTVNGGITLRVPPCASADINASTLNGRISANFPLQISGTLVSKRARGAIGGGGPQLDLTTKNGSIQLRRSSKAANPGEQL